MIKYGTFSFLISQLGFASILISSFDAFDGAAQNNSRNIANQLIQSLKISDPEIKIHHCELRTVYDKSVETLKDCYAQMDEKPKFIISLGEGGCRNLKIETRAVNLDHDITSDNDGIHRTNQPILEGASKHLPLSFNWSQAYCGLTTKQKKRVEISNNAGTFVCNHLSYKIRNEFPELSFAFAHVPTFNCASNRNVQKAMNTLKQLIVSVYKNETAFKLEPISKNETRQRIQSSSCEAQFYEELLIKYN